MVHVFVLSGVAFLLHFVWENVQCPLFFEHGSYEASLAAMVVAALGDVGITWVLYAAVATISRRWDWSSGRWSWRQWATLVGFAVAIAWAIETRAVSSGRWTYTPITPLLPGTKVSAVPVLQLLLLTPLSFRIAAKLSGAASRPRAS